MDYIVPNGYIRVTSKFRTTAKNRPKYLFDETEARHNLTKVSRLWVEYRKRSVKNKFLDFKKAII